MTTATETQQHWKKHVDAARAADQTLVEYARANELNLQTLYSHSRRINKAKKSPAKRAFVRVQRTAAAATLGTVHVELKNGVRVHVSAPFDLASLLNQVARLP